MIFSVSIMFLLQFTRPYQSVSLTQARFILWFSTDRSWFAQKINTLFVFRLLISFPGADLATRFCVSVPHGMFDRSGERKRTTFPLKRPLVSLMLFMSLCRLARFAGNNERKDCVAARRFLFSTVS